MQAASTAAPAGIPGSTPDPFAKAPTFEAFDVDVGFLREPSVLDIFNGRAVEEQARPAPPLLAADYRWRDAAGRLRIPLPLCEFLAYKAALAYEPEKTIEANLPANSQFRFFNSAADDTADQNAATKKIDRGGFPDTQGFGFVRDGMAFIVMRGTVSKADWQGNFEDALVSSLAGLSAPADPHALERLGDIKGEPGWHQGFARGWSVVANQVEAWLTGLQGATAIVLSGHSLGGALAQVGAFEMAMRHRRVAAVVTFGAPPVGNNFFAEAYDKLGLQERTVRLESDGDSVPKVMRRWYYRLHTSLRDTMKGFLTVSEAVTVPSGYNPVGATWLFSSQPPLDRNELLLAITSAIKAQERKAEEARKKSEAESKPKEKPRQTDSKLEPADGRTAEAPAQPAAEARTGNTASPQSNTATSGSDPRIFILIVASILTVVAVVVVWAFVRSKISSHAIMHRYALYLSTLSYQQIRALNPGHLAKANADLAGYLRFIRDDPGGGKTSYFAPVRELPVTLDPKDDLAILAASGQPIIC